MPDQAMNQIDIAEADEMTEDGEQTTVKRCLSFEVDDLILFLSTSHVVEIINGYSITTLPMIPPFIKGMINLRGQILPVVDIRLCMGKPSAEYTPKTCIIVLNIDSISLGVIVDSVRQVLDIDFQNVHPIPVKRQQKLLNGMIELDDGTVLLSFDCKALLDCRY